MSFKCSSVSRKEVDLLERVAVPVDASSPDTDDRLMFECAAKNARRSQSK